MQTGPRARGRHAFRPPPGILLALLAAAAPVVAAAAGASGPSFACTGAATTTERAICAMPRLALLDGILGSYYAQLRQSLPPAQRACLAADQRHWLASGRDACGAGAACLERAYLGRLHAFEGLLPGAALDRRLDRFPAVDAAPLLAILPAAVADAPPLPASREVVLEGMPLEDEGGYLLIDERFDHGAWQAYLELQGNEDALRARFGDGPPVSGIVGSFPGGGLDPRARTAIDGVAARGGRLRVHGRAVDIEAQAPAIDGGACAFIYLPGPR